MEPENDSDDLETNPEQNPTPVVHSPVDVIACNQCSQFGDTDLVLFDPLCTGCQQLLYDESTTISQMFAILRQWMPQVQQNAAMIIQQVLVY